MVLNVIIESNASNVLSISAGLGYGLGTLGTMPMAYKKYAKTLANEKATKQSF